MADLTVVLGAGFSKLAKIPIASELNKYFERDNTENVLSFSSGEFKWVDFANHADLNNGRLGFDHYAYGIILNEFVSRFVALKKTFSNYEDFYQYVIDNLNNQEVKRAIKASALALFHAKFPNITEQHDIDNYTHAITEFKTWEIKSLINHLISDLLFWRIPESKVISAYKPFVEFIKNFKTIDFITLNHDLLLEYLLKYRLNLEYSDGFTSNQKRLKTQKGKSLNIFDGKFEASINIVKLHGSIDIYKYTVAEENGSLIEPTGEYIYYKTHDYWEKQQPCRYIPETGEKVQSFHWGIDPNFITGTKKENIISTDEMYNSLYKETATKLNNCGEILIIGYSFSDEHVNKLIKIGISKVTDPKCIININPRKLFPFKSPKFKRIELSGICELGEDVINMNVISRILKIFIKQIKVLYYGFL